LRLACEAPGITPEISDDGAGFDPEGDFSGHLGLKSMRERAARLGGTLRVESAPGEGTTIRVQIPPVA
jgi:signal transduction histidine kinase